MKAYVLHGINDLRYEEAPMPDIKDNEVLLRVKAAGICGSDIPRIYETGAHVHPIIPGHEFAGEVVETGRLVDIRWMNKRVGVFPMIPCGQCRPCIDRHYELCRNYNYLGSRCNGGFAEYVAVPENNLIELPDSISYEEAAMLEPMSVAVHGIRRTNIQPEDNIVVCGLGTIGMFITMFLIEAGYNNLYVIGNKDTQKEVAIKLGLEESHFCDSRFNNVVDWINRYTEKHGADVFFECVGNNSTINLAMELAAPMGRIVYVGNPHSDVEINKDTYWKILRNQLTVTGTWNSSFLHEDNDDWHYVVDRISRHRVNPYLCITHKYGWDELEKGLLVMKNKSQEYIKIMIVEK